MDSFFQFKSSKTQLNVFCSTEVFLSTSCIILDPQDFGKETTFMDKKRKEDSCQCSKN